MFDALARGDRRRAGSVTVTYAAIRDNAPPRVAYGVSRKVGSAVARTRGRRRLREAVRRDIELLRPGGIYLISVSANAHSVPLAELSTALRSALQAFGEEGP